MRRSRQTATAMCLLFAFACAPASDDGANQDADAVPPETTTEAVDQPLDMPSETRIAFDCADAGAATMRFVGPETIELMVGEERYILPQERAASGAKYAAEGVSFWNQGDEAMLEIGEERHTCTRQSD